jgi:RHS repeat-associated protein
MPHLPTIRWNYKDQLSATSRQTVNEGEPVTTYYVYDASGQRARKVTEDESGKRIGERFYVGGFEVFREFAGGEIAMERETLHVMDDKQRIALVETRTMVDGHGVHAPTPEQRYQLANHLGSASVEIDEAGGLITYEEYSPYGDTTYQVGISGAEVRRKRFRYTAKERDQENGFTYHGARYYAPWLGRWTSTDPKGITAGYNLYAYCDGRPTTKVDPDGMDPTDNGAPPPPVTFGLTFDSNGLRTDGFVVGLGRAGMGGSYMDRAQNNTGLISINIQDRINFARGVGSHFPSSFQVEQDFLKPDGKNLFPMFSGVMVQEALEGKAAGAIHADTRGVNLVPPLSTGTLPGLSGDDFHSSSELRQIIAHIASTDADERKVDIFLQHEDGVSYLPKGSNQIQGAPLPSHLADRVPNVNNTPSDTGGAPGGTPGGGSSGGPRAPLIGPPSPAGAAVTTLTRTFVPGVSELETSLQGVSQLAYQYRLPLVGSGLATASQAVPVAGAGLAVGGIAGTVTETALLKAGADRDTAAVAGLGAAIYAGVRVGALVGAPFEGIGAVPGAIIGGIAGAIGFALFR